MNFIYLIIAAVVFVVFTIMALINRYRRCPSDKILVIYGSNDHVAMLTGQGRQIVHAANSRDGVKVNSDYNYSNNVKAILRIKGVN